MSFASAVFASDDFSIAAMGALMEARTLATNKLYYFTAQFSGDTEQTLRENANYYDINNVVNYASGTLKNGSETIVNPGAPLRIDVTRDFEGRVTSQTVVRADGTATVPPGRYTIDTNSGQITDSNLPGGPPPGGPLSRLVGYVELKTIDGGALSQVQSEINNAAAVISTFSNLIAANKAALKSVLNVIK